jgi:hypothetical protein
MSVSDEDLERFYNEHFDKLVEIAFAQFGIPKHEATDLIHDVLLSSLLHSNVPDLHAWMVGALTVAATHRQNGEHPDA